MHDQLPAPPLPSVGFLLLDTSMNLIVANRTAVEILFYPQRLDGAKSFRAILRSKIRSLLVAQPTSSDSLFVDELRSGRRLYFCRSFSVDRPAKGREQAKLAVLLERGPSRSSPALQAASERFHLTGREHEVLRHLLQGLTSKEIADRMNISPNTVKAFLRLIMVKMGVSTRSGIVGKAMSSSP